MINICEYCKKEYEYEEGQPNWGKNGPVTGRQFSMSSKRFCCYECGIKASNEKNKQTKLERYGSSTYNNTNKSKQTKLDKYGTASYVNVEQQKETRLKKLKSDSQYYKKQQEKREQTCLDKYGVKSVMQSDSIKESLKNSFIKKFGVDNPQKNIDVKNKTRETVYKKYGGFTLKSKELSQKVMNTNMEKYGVPYACMTDNCKQQSGIQISKINLHWKQLIEQLGYDVQLEKTINLFSYDLYIPKLNLLIDINPTITHQSTVEVDLPFGKVSPKEYDYHIKKYDLAVKAGYDCIMIWDWDSEEKLKTLLSQKDEVRLKDCEVREIESIEDCSIFLNKYHLQGSCRGQDIRIGLYIKDTNELISVMTFGKSRYNSKYEYEWLRYASCKKVHRALSKMFNYFIDKYNPTSIISYCDRSKFNGKMFQHLGFKILKHPKPSKHYFNRINKTHYTLNEVNRLGACKILNIPQIKKHINIHNEIVDNRYIMIKENYLEVFDCGQSSYIWNKGELNEKN